MNKTARSSLAAGRVEGVMSVKTASVSTHRSQMQVPPLSEDATHPVVSQVPLAYTGNNLDSSERPVSFTPAAFQRTANLLPECSSSHEMCT